MTPRIYITHHIRDEMVAINDFITAMLWHLEQLTPEPHQTVVVVWHPKGQEHLMEDLRSRAPKDVEFLFNDRPGRPDTLPSMRNACVIDARQYGADQLMVLLENDIRVSRGWLSTLLHDVQQAEETRGKRNVIMSPRFAPYHFLAPVEKEPPRQYPEFWEWIREHRTCVNAAEFGDWCRTHNVPTRDGEIDSKPAGWNEGGNLLMMFACRAGVFDRFGLCDESFTGWGYDDDDWGLRAIACGVCNAQSQGAWIGHKIGLTFWHPKHDGRHGRGALGANADNDVLLKKKWAALLAETQNIPGALWAHLRYGKPTAQAPHGPFYDLQEAIDRAAQREAASIATVEYERPVASEAAKTPWQTLADPARRQVPEVVRDLLALVAQEDGEVVSFVDAGAGVNGPVGQHWLEQLSGAASLHVLDIFKVREMPPRWKVHAPMDMRDMYTTFGPDSFDWVQAFDTIEHIPKEDGLKWLAEAKAMARKVVLVFCPTTTAQDGFVDNTVTEACYPDNPYQKHLSGWVAADFEALGFEVAAWGPGYLFALWRRKE